jgi:hypothetical protein
MKKKNRSPTEKWEKIFTQQNERSFEQTNFYLNLLLQKKNHNNNFFNNVVHNNVPFSAGITFSLSKYGIKENHCTWRNTQKIKCHHAVRKSFKMYVRSMYNFKKWPMQIFY